MSDFARLLSLCSISFSTNDFIFIVSQECPNLSRKNQAILVKKLILLCCGKEVKLRSIRKRLLSRE